jgi:hypothetical protein
MIDDPTLGTPQAGAGLVTTFRRRLKLALKPASHIFGVERVGTVAIETLELTRSFAAKRQRKDQEGPAVGAGRTFSLAHDRDFKMLILKLSVRFRTQK